MNIMTLGNMKAKIEFDQDAELRGGLGNLNAGDKWYFCSQSAFVDEAGVLSRAK